MNPAFLKEAKHSEVNGFLGGSLKGNEKSEPGTQQRVAEPHPSTQGALSGSIKGGLSGHISRSKVDFALILFGIFFVFCRTTTGVFD